MIYQFYACANIRLDLIILKAIPALYVANKSVKMEFCKGVNFSESISKHEVVAASRFALNGAIGNQASQH